VSVDGRLSAGGLAGLTSTTFTLLSNVLTGVLGLPFVFAHCGIALGALLLVLVAASQVFTLKQLVYCAAVLGVDSYDELVLHTLGRAGRPLLLSCTIALQLGCLVAFYDILSDMAAASVSPLFPGADLERGQLMVAIVVLVLLCEGARACMGAC
jgi:amino acid permease